MTGSSALLELNAVELSRGGRTLISDLSLTLAPGQLALVTGPNGSGKTTLLRAIAGLADPDRGQIRLGGVPVRRLEPEARAGLAYLGHLDGLKRDLTVEENIRFYSALRHVSENPSQVVAEAGLAPFAHRSVRQLSAGQKRRIVLAVLRLSGARLWLLDEPLTNLDRPGRELVARWLDRHLAGQGIAVVATHLAEALERPGALLVEL